MRFIERLPRGTLLIGGGLLMNGLAAYAFVTLAARNLGPEAYTPVGMLWALSFMLGPGFFQPLEQETARTIASRFGRGVAPVVRSAAAIGGLVALGLAVVGTVASPWLVDGVFDGEPRLLVGLLLVVVGLGVAHLAKGVLAGLGRFGGYARYVVGEGLGRLLAVGLLVAVVSDVRSSINASRKAPGPPFSTVQKSGWHRPRRRMVTGWLQRWATFDRLLKIAKLWPNALTASASSIARSAMPGFGISAWIFWTSPPISWTRHLTRSFT